MVKALVTSNCASHKHNNSYPTLLILFEGSETNVRPFNLRGNWQPTDKEFKAAVRLLASISPTFAEWLINYGHLLEFNAPQQPPSNKIKTITELADVLL